MISQTKSAKTARPRVCSTPGCTDPVGCLAAGDPRPFREALLGNGTKPAKAGTQAPSLKPQASRPVSPATRVPEAEWAVAQVQNGLRGEGRDIPIDAIVASPFNPRQEFAEKELLNLAASITAHGLLEPIVVRPRGDGRYELVAGERRWKACQRAGLAKIPAVVRELDDQQAREICVLENLQRKDLSPIEEAEGFKMLLEGPNAPTQAELGARLGISQGQIANRLGLLRLPACWRKRIASGQIPATHARALVPYASVPKLAAAIEKHLGPDLDSDGAGTIGCFEDNVRWAVRDNSHELIGEQHEWQIHKPIKYFTPTEEQRKQLEVVEIPGAKGKPVEVALNVKLWKKLQKAHVERTIKEHHAKESKAKKPPKKPAAEMSRAEKKLEAARQKQREREQAEQFAKRLANWRIDWLRYLISRTVFAAGDQGGRALVRLLLYFATSPGTFKTLGDIQKRAKAMAPILKEAGHPLKQIRDGWYSQEDLWSSIAPLPSAGMHDVVLVARDFARNMFWSEAGPEAGPGQTVPARDVEAIAAWLGIDLAATWKREQAGPLTESYLALHTKEQLAELAGTWNVYVKPETPKGTMIRLLTVKDRPTTLPKELAKGGKTR